MDAAQLVLIPTRAGDPCPFDRLARARAILGPLLPALEERERLDPEDARAALADLWILLLG
jgi:hypothetical protein